MKQQKIYLNWSSGKDAAYALHILQKDPSNKVEKLLTTVNGNYQRVTMHGLRIELLELQAERLGIPLQKMTMPANPSMETYEAEMKSAVDKLRSEGFNTAAFGDIFLQDLREYRDAQLDALGMSTLYPLWQKDTSLLAHEMIEAGFKARIVALNEGFLDKEFAGAEFDQYFLDHLPENVDPCGENGEFHTFCYDGPIFDSPIDCTLGEIVSREYPDPTNKQAVTRIWFADLLTA